MGSESILKPYRGVDTHIKSGTLQSTQSGFVVERLSDFKSALIKNPPGAWRPPSPYSRHIESGNCYTVNFAKDYTDFTFDSVRSVSSGADDCSGNWYTVIQEAPSYLEDQCITQALLQLKGMQVNLAQNFGEREQTARLCYDTCRRLAGMVYHTRETAFKLLKDPFSLWLELQYGWLPLLSDVHGAVHEIMDKPPTRVTVRGKASDTWYDKSLCTLGKTTHPVYIDRITKGVHHLNLRLDYEEGNAAARQAASLGLTNPADLAWELLPFSFVVDWFANVGDCFNVLDATFGWDFKGGSCTTTSRMRYDATNPRLQNPGTAVGSSSCQARGYQMTMNRKVYSSSPMPQRPHLKPQRNGVHVANGIALLGAAFLKKLRVR